MVAALCGRARAGVRSKGGKGGVAGSVAPFVGRGEETEGLTVEGTASSVVAVLNGHGGAAIAERGEGNGKGRWRGTSGGSPEP